MHDMDTVQLKKALFLYIEELFHFSTEIVYLNFSDIYIHYLHKDDITKASDFVYDVWYNCYMKQVNYHTKLLWCIHTIKKYIFLLTYRYYEIFCYGKPK